jgi:hypothetical protein
VEVEFECDEGCGWQRVLIDDLGDASTQVACPECQTWHDVDVPPAERDPDA